jgi:hypothetical protein
VKARVEGPGARRENRQFLAKSGLDRILFFRNQRQAQLALLPGDRTGGLWRSKAGNDSEMAPQTIEITRNGLENGDPPVRGRWEGEID